MHPDYEIPSALTLQPKVHCYGKSAALCAECLTINQPHKDLPTINLDVAPFFDQSNRTQYDNKKINWQHKITIQLNESELVATSALFLGYLGKLHLKRPGKGIEIERQQGNIFVRATAGKGRNYPLPVSTGDCFKLSCLFLSQIKTHMGNMDESLILAALRGAAILQK